MDSFMDLFAEYGLFLGIPLVFLVIIVWVYRPGSGKRYREDGQIPFQDDDKRSAAPP